MKPNMLGLPGKKSVNFVRFQNMKIDFRRGINKKCGEWAITQPNRKRFFLGEL